MALNVVPLLFVALPFVLAMDAMYENVASGSMAGDFGAIKGQAYGGG